MNKLLAIETFVLGASIIAAIYHLVLFIQQHDKFLMYYSLYLFTLSTYIGFKLWSNNYDPFSPTSYPIYYILEEVIQVVMVSVYVLFAAQTLEVIYSKSIVQRLMYCFFILAFVSIGVHIYGALVLGHNVNDVKVYALSRIGLVSIATLALLFAWRIRTSTFQRTIILGSFVYDASGLLSIISFVTHDSVMGLTGVEPYLIGCLVDIIIFSSALGYRIKKVADEKNLLLQKAVEARLAVENTRMGIAIDLHDNVGSVLSSMSIYSEAAARALHTNQLDRTTELLHKIGDNARETMSSMSEIVWSINPKNDIGEKLFNKMESFAMGILDAKNIVFKMHVDNQLLQAKLLMPVRQNLFLIFKEAINNAAKYSQASTVTVRIDEIIKGYNMIIFDNGKGFDTTAKTNGNGLKNISDRAKTIDGILNIVSNENGTTISIFVNK